jgi:diguanylate cyclase (GGDEF)-like protein/PAS domain S-box-containing protein
MMVREQLLARMIDEFPEIVLVLSGEGDLLWANKTAEKLFNATIEETAGVSALEFVHPDDLELVLRSFESVQLKEIGNPLEIRIKIDDTWRLIELIGVPINWYREGSLLFSLRDLTDRRRFEVARDDVARFRSLVHNATAIMILTSPVGKIESVSGALTRMLGHDPELVEGSSLVSIVAKEDREKLEQAMASAHRDSTASNPVVTEVRLLHYGTNDEISYQLSIVNLVDDPTVQGFVITANDVSARVQAELELRDTSSLLNATLEATADGILVVDRDRSISSFNAQFASMWRIPSTVIDQRDDQLAVGAVLDQVVDPVAFQARVEELYSQPSSDSKDTIYLKDGRVFSRSSKPQFVGGAIVGRVWSFNDITEQKRLEDDLAHLAFHDVLTGLANRALFKDRLDQAVMRGERTNKLTSVLFLDVDNFKTINDSLGHSVGDQLLVAVAESLRICLRRSDTAARLGGDEFAVLIEDVENHDEVIALADRILSALREPITIGTHKVSVTVSIGITFGTAGTSGEQLLSNADLAMYLAKAQGKNRYEEFEDKMHTAVVERLELESDLRDAVLASEFRVYYQPIFELTTGSIKGFEALARWQHPTKGLVLPDTFIPFAEELGLIHEIDHWMLDVSCNQAQRWANQGLVGPDLALSVNLSARELVDLSLRDSVAEVLESSGFDPVNLILEVTESAVMMDIQAAIRNLGALKSLGLRVAIDDFGTGYSSFSHLEKLPIDIVKIDRSFVGAAPNADRKIDLTEIIVHLSAALGLVSIAEGVETAEQASRLIEMGCSLAQGFYLGMPLSTEKTEALLKSRLIEPEA